MKGWSGFFSFFGYVSILGLFLSFLSLNPVVFLSALFATLFFFFFSGLCKRITDIIENQNKILNGIGRLMESQSLLHDALDPVSVDVNEAPVQDPKSQTEEQILYRY